MSIRSRSLLTLATALCVAVPVTAQQGAAAADAAPVAAVQATAPVSLAPTLAGETVGIRRAAATTAEAPHLQQSSNSRNVTWMIVGGAALVVGSVVGGDAGTIIMVTGAVIGLVGLFRYLQ